MCLICETMNLLISMHFSKWFSQTWMFPASISLLKSLSTTPFLIITRTHSSRVFLANLLSPFGRRKIAIPEYLLLLLNPRMLQLALGINDKAYNPKNVRVSYISCHNERRFVWRVCVRYLVTCLPKRRTITYRVTWPGLPNHVTYFY